MTEQQKETLSALTEVIRMFPEIRLGQLMAHLGFLGEVHLEKSLANLDDDELLALVYRHRAELAARQSASSLPLSVLDHDATSISGSSTTPTNE